jgi:hypothetical protein
MSSFKAGKTIDSPEKSKKKTLSNGGGDGKMSTESAGIKTGLSERMALDTKSGDPQFDTKRNSLTGNATERRKPTNYKSVAGGFQIEE